MKRRSFFQSLLGIPVAARISGSTEPPKQRHLIERTALRFNGYDPLTQMTRWRRENTYYRPDDFHCEDLDVIVPTPTRSLASSGPAPDMAPLPIRIRGLRDGEWFDVMVIEPGYYLTDQFRRIPMEEMGVAS